MTGKPESTEKFQITNFPPKSLGLRFSECQQKWNISVSHYEKIEKWLPFLLISIVQKNSKSLTSSKVWVSGYPSVNINGISVLAIMKKLKNGRHFINIDHTEKFQITDNIKVWVSSFLSVSENGISVLAIMKKSKNGCHFINIDHTEKFQMTYFPFPKVWVSSFSSVDRNRILVSTIMKKIGNGHHFINIDHTEKFQITDTLQSLDLRFSECQWKWNISVGHYEKIEKWQPFH